MSYGTPQPGDDAQLRAWRRRYTEDRERTFSLRLPLALARRLRREAAARGLPHSRYVADLLRVALGDLPGGPALAPTPTPAAPALASTPPPAAPTPASPAPAAQGQVDLRALRIIQLREGEGEGRAEPRQLDTADKATVLRILRADLAWLERDGADKDA
jgi:transposase-like protein